MNDKPGINGEEFKIILDRNWIDNPVTSSSFEYKCKIVGIKRNQWYWRILHYITFKRYFGIQYELKIIDGPKLVTG